MTRLKWVLFILAWLLVAAISIRSHYDIRDVHSMNWDIALMLSPYGFIHNFILDSANYLRPYYDVAAQRGDLFKDPVLGALVITSVAVACAGLFVVRRSRTP